MGILTAAHCTRRLGDKDYFIEAGITEEGNLGEHGQKALIESYAVHPNYNRYTKDSDLAILKLSSPLTFNAHVRPACLPPNEDFYPENVIENVKGVVSGWGLLKDPCHLYDGYRLTRECPCLWLGESCCVNEDTYDCKKPVAVETEKLQYVSIPLMTNEKCREFWPSKLIENRLCAGFEKIGCFGDSGGPLVISRSSMPIPIVDTAVIYGIVSSGYECGSSIKPALYTRVSRFLPWIQSFLEL